VLRSISLIAAQHPLALERLGIIDPGGLIGAAATNRDDEGRTLRGPGCSYCGVRRLTGARSRRCYARTDDPHNRSSRTERTANE
jgi:hypothetical protein